MGKPESSASDDVPGEEAPDVVGPSSRLRMSLNDLAQGFPAVTPTFGMGCAEAGAVCLEGQGHHCGVNLKVGGGFSQTFELHWPDVHDQMRSCWNDPQIATEHGAYGISFLLVKELTDYTVIERSRKGTGFDFWLGKSASAPLFQDKARLEVSGILKGTVNQVNARVSQKLAQTNPSDSSRLPAYVVVVEFSQPQTRVVEK